MKQGQNDVTGFITDAIIHLEEFLSRLPPMALNRIGELKDLLQGGREILQLHEDMKKHPKPDTFAKELEALINRYNQEAKSNTPDFVLGQFIRMSMGAFNHAVNNREKWHGRPMAFQKEESPEEFNKNSEALAAEIRKIKDTAWGAAVGDNSPEIGKGLLFKCSIREGVFKVLEVYNDETCMILKPCGNQVRVKVEFIKHYFNSGDYWEVKQILKGCSQPEQFKSGGCLAPLFIGADFGHTSDALAYAVQSGVYEKLQKAEANKADEQELKKMHTYKKKVQYVDAELLEMRDTFEKWQHELCKAEKNNTRTYKAVTKQLEEIRAEIERTAVPAGEAVQKAAQQFGKNDPVKDHQEAMDTTAKMIEQTLEVVRSFTLAAKAIKEYKNELKGLPADAHKVAGAVFNEPGANASKLMQ